MTFTHRSQASVAPTTGKQQKGFTLTELLAVAVLIGLAAVIVAPSGTVADSRKLDLMATEMANAMRFARSEAVRTGTAHGIYHQQGSLRLRVFSFVPEDLPPIFTYDVYHPIEKTLYDRQFELEPYSFDGTVTNSLQYRDACTRKQAFFFDADGVAWCTDPTNVLMENFEVTLAVGNETRVITVQGVTGRVTVR